MPTIDLNSERIEKMEMRINKLEKENAKLVEEISKLNKMFVTVYKEEQGHYEFTVPEPLPPFRRYLTPK